MYIQNNEDVIKEIINILDVYRREINQDVIRDATRLYNF